MCTANAGARHYPCCTLGITHAAHSAVIKTPDFPQDSSPRLVDEKVTHMSKISPPLHLGRKTIFLDRLNETMTAVSNENREGRKTDIKKAKERREENEGEGWEGEKERDRVTVSSYIFSFSLTLARCRSIKH